MVSCECFVACVLRLLRRSGDGASPELPTERPATSNLQGEPAEPDGETSTLAVGGLPQRRKGAKASKLFMKSKNIKELRSAGEFTDLRDGQGAVACIAASPVQAATSTTSTPFCIRIESTNRE